MLSVEAARRAPRDFDELAHVPGVSPKHVRKIGRELLSALERAAELGPLEHPPQPSRKDGSGAARRAGVRAPRATEQLAPRARRAARARLVAVLNRHVLVRLAQRKPIEEGDLAHVDGLLDWQINMFGPEILDTWCAPACASFRS